MTAEELSNSGLENGVKESNHGFDMDAEESRLSAPDFPSSIASLATPVDNSRAPSAERGLTENGAPPPPRHTNDKRINEEYKIWKKNIPYLYDMFMMTATQFPTYTIDWIEDVEDVIDAESGCEFWQQKIVIGTTARSDSEAHFNGIILLNVRTPKDGPEGFGKLDDKTPEFRPSVGLFTGSQNIISIHGIICQSIPITHARVMPQKNEFVCAKLADSSVVIYDWKTELKHGWSFEDPIVEKPPMLELQGHDLRLPSAHGLAWNPSEHKAGVIASCAKDGKISVWDICGAKRRQDVKPHLTITGHETEIQDIAWHPLHSTIIGSAGVDKCFCLFDVRSRNLAKPSHRVEAHEASVNAISFAFSESIFATGSDDGTVALWDMRNLSRKLHSLKYHANEVFTIDWCQDVERASLLASGGADRRICLWDVRKIGEKQERVDLTTPPELLFVHGGHSGRVTDVTWNPAQGRKLMVASVAEDCIVQAWMPAKYQIWPLDHRDSSTNSKKPEVGTSNGHGNGEEKKEPGVPSVVEPKDVLNSLPA